MNLPDLHINLVGVIGAITAGIACGWFLWEVGLTQFSIAMQWIRLGVIGGLFYLPQLIDEVFDEHVNEWVGLGRMILFVLVYSPVAAITYWHLGHRHVHRVEAEAAKHPPLEEEEDGPES